MLAAASTATCPAVLISAPASGQGKTSITAALARYHRRQGLRVRCFKTGPDFIDPTILARASGQAVYNLDTWIMGLAHCQQLLYEAALDNDLILVEGVMGLFDGEPSSADLAEQFGLPVLPVIDASAMAQTFAAVLYGLSHFRPSLKIAGAVANCVASAGHGALLGKGLPADLAFSSVIRNADARLPERHLGLHVAQDIADIEQRLDALADAIADTALADVPAAVTFAAAEPLEALPQLLQGKTIAVARDAAFCFLYAQNLHCLKRMGAKLVYFSPLQDSDLPPADALYLPGGYPELYAETLAVNQGMRAAIVQHVAAAKPVFAECGGMLYLSEYLLDQQGQQHALLGILQGTATMQSRLAGIGSQAFALFGQVMRGHTFHYSTLETSLNPITRATTSDGREGEAVYQVGSVLASYWHAYFPSNPALAARLFLSGE